MKYIKLFEAFELKIDNLDYHTYQFKEDGHAIGYVILDHIDSYDEIFLSSFTINAEYKNKGFGKKYLKIILEELNKFDITWLGMTVGKTNDVALKLYKSFGFEEPKDVAGYKGHALNYKNEHNIYLIKKNK